MSMNDESTNLSTTDIQDKIIWLPEYACLWLLKYAFGVEGKSVNIATKVRWVYDIWLPKYEDFCKFRLL